MPYPCPPPPTQATRRPTGKGACDGVEGRQAAHREGGDDRAQPLGPGITLCSVPARCRQAGRQVGAADGDAIR